MSPTKLASAILVAVVALVTFAPDAEAQNLRVIPVPWVATDVTIPHQAYNGKATIFKAVARGGTGSYRVEWDFLGDGFGGPGDVSFDTNNRYDLSRPFQYPNQATTTTFQAKIRVTSPPGPAGAGSVTGTYPVRVFADVPLDPNAATDRQLQVMRSVAVDNGLWYLHTQLSRTGAEEDALAGAQITGNMGGNAQTSGFLWSLGLNGHFAAWGPAYIGEMRDAADNAARFANDPYAEDAARLINYLLGQTTIVNVNSNGVNDEANLTGFYPEVSAQPIFGTDDGIGVYISYGANEAAQNLTIYPMGHAVSAFSVQMAGINGYVAQVGDANRVLGRKFEHVLQQMVDALVWHQNDGGQTGSWFYYSHGTGNNPGGSDDLSTTLWGLTGAWHADEFAKQYGVIVPNITKTRLVDYIRGNKNNCPQGGSGGSYNTSYDAACGFTVSAAHMLTLGWVGSNTFAAADGRIAFPGYSGTTRGQLRSQFDTSLTFIGNTFTTSPINEVHGCWNSGMVHDGNYGRTDGLGNHYAMLHWQDAARAVVPEQTMFGANNWFRAFSRYLINNQLANGNWRWVFSGQFCPNSDNAGGEYARNAWAMLVLSPDAIPPLAIATSSVVAANEGTAINFNGSASDPGSGNPVYTWAFGNGQTLGGQNVAYAYPDNGNFTVSLTSTSIGGTSIDSFNVAIANVAPAANAGPDKTVNEGAATGFDVTVTDPGTADTFGYVWAWQDMTANGAVKSLNHTFADNAVRDVVVTVTDDDGGSGNDTVRVTVNNVAPTITSSPPANPAAIEGQQFAYDLTWTDPGTLDTFACSAPIAPAGSNIALVAGKCQFRWTPNFAQAIGSSAPVRACVTDDDMGQTCQDFTISVAFLDNDHDGLPDSWEVANFGNVGAADQFGDPDQDGMNNLQEFNNVTNPNTYDGPNAPVPQAPVCGAEIATQQTALTARNAVDPQAGQALLYRFELYRDAAMTILVVAQDNVAQGAGMTTSYQVPVSLLENTRYWWRVRAKDPFVSGAWSAPACAFFVNTANEPPNAPRINSPVLGGQANSLTPLLKVDNAVDPDEDVLTYSYEVYRDQVLSQLVASANGRPAGIGQSSWQVNVNLNEDTTYYWRARAVDPDGLAGDWSTIGQFFVTTVNSAPQPPVIVAPQNGTLVTTLRPELISLNANDSDQDPLRYDWQLATDASFAVVVASGNDVPSGGVVSTRFLLSNDLTEDNRYCWRVRSDDGQAVSAYVSACFLVSANNAAPSVPVLDTPGNNATGVDVSPTYYWAPSTDAEGAPITYDIQVLDAGGQVVQAVNNVSGTNTSMPVALQFDTTYRWRARAVDSSGAASNFSATNRFTTTFRDQDGDELPDSWETQNFGGIGAQDQFGDPDHDGRNNRQEYTGGTNPNQYDGPGTPTTNTPVCGTEVGALPVALVAGNTVGAPGVALTYQFEVYSDVGMSQQVAQRDNIMQGAGMTTSWQVPVNLVENRRYWWRVRAKDPFTYGPYSAPACAFFVNTMNDPPGVPAVIAPLDSVRVNTLRPTLTIANTTDVDEDVLTYQFQVYSDPALMNLVASKAGQAAGNGQTSWQVDVNLGEDRTYYWRARAADADNLGGAWTPTTSFFVSAENSAPQPPAIISPQNNVTVAVLRPELLSLNAQDVDHDVLVYDWALAREAAFTNIVASANDVPTQGPISMRFLLAGDLMEDNRYCWRVRADDGLTTSAYSTACFLVSAQNAPPSVPVLNNPANGAQNAVITPSFTWAPSTDAEGEAITYDVQLLDTNNVLAQEVLGVNGTTTQMPAPVLYETTYRWRARAVDRSGAASAFSAVNQFTTGFQDDDGDLLPDRWEIDQFGDTTQDPGGDPDGDGRSNMQEYVAGTDPNTYDGPNAPTPSSPACDDVVDNLHIILIADNAVSPPGSPLRYEFGLYRDSGLTNLVASEDDIPEGAGSTEWAVPFNLQENGHYYWRVRAKDDWTAGPWSAPPCHFFVNVQNEAPGTPRINSPAIGGQVNVTRPDLTIDNTMDPDGDPLTYTFNVYADAALANQVTEGAGVVAGGAGSTTWQVDVDLQEDQTYYWRARAVDNSGLSGPSTAIGSFFVSTANSPPGAPTILLPLADSVVPTLRPELAIVNGEDVDHDTLVYDWQLATDLTFQNVIDSGVDVPTQSLVSTRFQLANDLTEDVRYCWRARSDDGQATSPYATACFVVSATNAPPSTPVLNNPSNGSTVPSLQPVFSWAPSTDIEGEPITYDVEVLNGNNVVVTSVTGVVGTATLMPNMLVAETSYRWRARAVDQSGGMSPFSATNMFATGFLDADNDQLPDSWEITNFGNIQAQDQFGDPDSDGRPNLHEYLGGTNPNTYNGPGAPTPSMPACGSELPNFNARLVVNNAAGPPSLRYTFELYRDLGLSIPVASQGNIAQGVGTTQWLVPQALTENTHYYWRARAKDAFTFGPYSAPACGFFVNTMNEAPGAPRLNSPAAGGQVNSLRPTLVIDNASDPDEDLLTYTFEVYSEPALTTLVASQAGVPAGPSTTAWQVTMNLVEDRTYYWRARATDPDTLSGGWTATGEFFVTTTNSPPEVPTISAPQEGAVVPVVRPELIILDAADVDHDVLVYDWDLATDRTFANVIDMGTDQRQRVFGLSRDLEEDVHYCWRVRSDDGMATSAYATACFTVSTVNAPPTVPVSMNPSNDSRVTTLQPAFSWAQSTDPEGEPITYEVEVMDDAGTVVTSIAGVSGNVTATADELENGAEYTWHVRAVDRSGGTSAYSTAHKFRVDYDTGDTDVSISGQGCGCRTSSRGSGATFLLLGLGVVGLLRRRRGTGSGVASPCDP